MNHSRFLQQNTFRPLDVGMSRMRFSIVGCFILLAMHCVPLAAAANVTEVTVTSSQDIVNGDTSSVSSLLADPGPDGISLREAIDATNNSPGTYLIDFATPLTGSTITLLSQLPPLIGGDVTIVGNTPGGQLANITVEGGSTFSDKTGFVIASSGNTISSLAISDFGTGVDIDPPPLLGKKLATHETFADNTVSNMVMTNIEQDGVLIGSMYLLGCGLYGGSATPCTTADTWSNTTITGNTITASGAGVAIKDDDAGDTFLNTEVTANTIHIQSFDSGISFGIIGNATGSTISGGVIAHNVVIGSTGQGIEIADGGNRASGNSLSNVQVVDNTVTLTNADTNQCCQGIVVLAGTDTPAALDPSVLPLGHPDSNQVREILLQGNSVSGTLTTGIQVVAGLGNGGSSNSISGVTIESNQVSSTSDANGLWIVNGDGESTFPDMRLASNNSISNVTVSANRIFTGSGPISSGTYATLLIEGGGFLSQFNSISNVQIFNNIIASISNDVEIVGGDDKMGVTSENTVNNVSLINNTFFDPHGTVFQVVPNENGDSASSVEKLTVSNSILWGLLGTFPPNVVIGHSLVTSTRLVKKNKNVSGNPYFMMPASGNFGLQTKSPARGKGTYIGAPLTDINGHVRSKKKIDIGAVQSS